MKDSSSLWVGISARGADPVFASTSVAYVRSSTGLIHVGRPTRVHCDPCGGSSEPPESDREIQMLEHKGYKGHVVFDPDAGLFHGEVLDTRDVVTFQGTSVNELEEAFRDSIDDYLEFCADRDEEPDKPFSGRLMVRLSSDLHRELYLEAKSRGKSLNQLIAERLARAS